MEIWVHAGRVVGGGGVGTKPVAAATGRQQHQGQDRRDCFFIVSPSRDSRKTSPAGSSRGHDGDHYGAKVLGLLRIPRFLWAPTRVRAALRTVRTGLPSSVSCVLAGARRCYILASPRPFALRCTLVAARPLPCRRPSSRTSSAADTFVSEGKPLRARGRAPGGPGRRGAGSPLHPDRAQVGYAFCGTRPLAIRWRGMESTPGWSGGGRRVPLRQGDSVVAAIPRSRSRSTSGHSPGARADPPYMDVGRARGPGQQERHLRRRRAGDGVGVLADGDRIRIGPMVLTSGLLPQRGGDARRTEGMLGKPRGLSGGAAGSASATRRVTSSWSLLGSGGPG